MRRRTASLCSALTLGMTVNDPTYLTGLQRVLTCPTMTTRVGFLGGGFIAHYHGKMLHTSDADAQIAWVYDPDPVKADGFASASGAAVAESPQKLLDSVD